MAAVMKNILFDFIERLYSADLLRTTVIPLLTDTARLGKGCVVGICCEIFSPKETLYLKRLSSLSGEGCFTAEKASATRKDIVVSLCMVEIYQIISCFATV